MSILDHIVLFLILFGVFFLFTQIEQKNINKHFEKITILPILIYSLILGCRYGWGNDFLWYKYRFENPYGYEDEDIGFRSINLFLSNIGFDYTGAFIVYSLVFIIGAFTLLKFYHQNKYMLCLFLPATILFSTATIRESFATSFAYIAYYLIFKKKYIVATIPLLCMSSIHSAPFIPFLLIIGLYICNKRRLIPLKWALGIYLIFFFFHTSLEAYLITPLNNILSTISLDNKYQSYIENADIWFSEEGKNNIYQQSTLTATLMFLYHISIIYIGYIGLKYTDNKYIRCFYHAIIIGLCMLILCFQLEILRRIAEAIIQLYYIPIGYSIAIITSKKSILTKKEYLYYRISLFTFISYLILYFGRFIFLSPEFKFYWNI